MSERYFVAFTGHRPSKLHGVTPFVRAWLRDQLVFLQPLDKLAPLTAITGMALGVDTIAAQLCVEMRIPFIAAIPFEGQEEKWKPEERDRYRLLLNFAEQIEIVGHGPYTPSLYHRRNAWMVDRCDYLCAVWDGSLGGTASCVAYAQKAQKLRPQLDGMRFNPKTRKSTRLFPDAPEVAA